MAAGSPPPEEGCRPATLSDLARLTELAAQAVDELRQGRGGEVWARTAARRPPFEPSLRAQVADGVGHRVVVGLLDDAVFGYAVAALQPPPGAGAPGSSGPLGSVTDLYVEPGARGLGIGEAMMRHLVQWCTEEGCYGVDSLALPGDRATKNFFEAFGLTARAILVHKALG